jgi:hypothetical protein
MMKGQSIPAGSYVLEFTTDGQLTYTNATGSFTGRYSLGSNDYVTIYLDRPLQGRRTHRQKIIILGDTMQLIDSDGTSVTFDRVKE